MTHELAQTMASDKRTSTESYEYDIDRFERINRQDTDLKEFLSAEGSGNDFATTLAVYGYKGPHQEMCTRLEQAVASDTTIYDDNFQDAVDRYGPAFVELFTIPRSYDMGIDIVKAFLHHDRKEYGACADAFGRVYKQLLDVSEEDAYRAGGWYAQALIFHDIIEDGAEEVQENIKYGDCIHHRPEDHVVATTAKEIEEHVGWNHVNNAFQQVAETLGLPAKYAFHQTEFFRFHTAVNEGQDVRSRFEDDSDTVDASEAVQESLKRFCRSRMKQKTVHNARAAQKLKFGTLIDNEDLLNNIANTYLEAVESHDNHTHEDDIKNVRRMAQVYQTVLREQVFQR